MKTLPADTEMNVMMNQARSALAALGAVAVLTLTTAAPATAQGMAGESPRLTFDARGGMSVPTGSVSDLADVGPTFGLGVGYNVHPRVTIRADGDVEMLGGAELSGGMTAPDVNLWHYNLGVEVELTPPAARRWDVTANLAGGATTWDTDEFAGATDGFSETYFTGNGGLKFAYMVARNVNVFVGGQWYLQFTDEAETLPLAQTAGLTRVLSSTSDERPHRRMPSGNSESDGGQTPPVSAYMDKSSRSHRETAC